MLIFALFFFLFISCFSSQTPVCFRNVSDAQRAQILNAHNKYRNKLASGGLQGFNGSVFPAAANMKELVWDTAIENFAQNYTNSDPDVHNPNAKNLYGENLYWFSKSCSDKNQPGIFDASVAVSDWFNESRLYDGNTVYGSQKTNSVVGHFTQVVWAETEAIGCGISDCVTVVPQARWTVYKQHVIILCNYRVAGNMYNRNIYLSGTPCTNCTCSATFTSLCQAKK